jgi:hypothetical protein
MAMKLVVTDPEGGWEVVPLGDREMTFRVEAGRVRRLEGGEGAGVFRLEPVGGRWVFRLLDTSHKARLGGSSVDLLVLPEGEELALDSLVLRLSGEADLLASATASGATTRSAWVWSARVGDLPAFVFSWEGDELIVGRGSRFRCESGKLRIPDKGVSAEHCRIWLERGVFRIEDLGSRNGTFVDGRRVKRPRLVAPGAVISLGGCELVLHDRGGGGEQREYQRLRRAGSLVLLGGLALLAAWFLYRLLGG